MVRPAAAVGHLRGSCLHHAGCHGVPTGVQRGHPQGEHAAVVGVHAAERAVLVPGGDRRSGLAPDLRPAGGRHLSMVRTALHRFHGLLHLSPAQRDHRHLCRDDEPTSQGAAVEESDLPGAAPVPRDRSGRLGVYQPGRDPRPHRNPRGAGVLRDHRHRPLGGQGPPGGHRYRRERKDQLRGVSGRLAAPERGREELRPDHAGTRDEALPR
mmetsp:Transcript_9580/g.22762  ORF Transcript_9580/g.22762 Transcript_9580/m.22762 type:complete len:211 (-) Transcript_9580:131-763(-)